MNYGNTTQPTNNHNLIFYDKFVRPIDVRFKSQPSNGAISKYQLLFSTKIGLVLY